MQNQNNQPKTNFPKMEKDVLKFWQENKIFEKSLSKDAPNGDYVFYDGPPFATGLPHYGHIVASTQKDVIPRYKTMQGYRVERQWGWDCHGLPVENIIEKELGLKTKEDIKKIGIDKFNEACSASVMKYADEWKKFIPRMGRWVDMDHDYKTMDVNYMESIWWVFKTLWDKGLIYEGYKSMHLCPRCETILSNFEVTQGYKDIKDLSVIAKFKTKKEPNLYVLAWTTTPWTLPGNVALAVGENIDYVKVEMTNKELGIEEFFILAKELVEKVFKDKEYDIIEELKGKDLVGLEYEPLFDYFANQPPPTPPARVGNLTNENGWKIYAGDFVTTDDGTGVVHIAPAFGDDDMKLVQKHDLPFVQHVKMNGHFVDEVVDFKDMEVKPKENHSATDIEIIKWLARNDKLFHKEKYEHSYPHCWRCDTPLLNYATSSWFVKVEKLKDKMLENNAQINWTPQHIKDGRFGKWLENARDWAISRSRFWGTPLPVWKCENDKCNEVKVVGSIKELDKNSNNSLPKKVDLHKQHVDNINFKCEKCDGEMKRIPEVLDCWFESGSMPYAQKHYMGEPLSDFDPETGKNFPAEFISEGVDQTRGWFYTLTVLATALFDKPAFKNVIVNGIVLAEDGQKMSKRLKNYPDPNELINKYGADAMRYYLMSSPVVKAGDLSFSETGVAETFRKTTMLLWNVYSFYETFESQLKIVDMKKESDNILDQWILAKLNILIKEVTDNLENYDLQKASRPILEFINELSTWYIRRSRDRFKFGSEEDKQSALQTTNYVLLTLSKIMAPFTPFIAESLYQKVKLKNEEDSKEAELHAGSSASSVHLEKWPKELKIENKKVIEDMEIVQKIVEDGLSDRAQNQIKVRQVLNSYSTSLVKENELDKNLVLIIKEELNIKELKFGENKLDVNITPKLKLEGFSREIIRTINLLRKNAGLSINDTTEIVYQDNIELQKVFDKFGNEILKDTLSTKHNISSMEDVEMKKEVKIDEEKVFVGIK